MCPHLNVIIYSNSILIEAKISLGRCCHAVSYLIFCGGELSVVNNDIFHAVAQGFIPVTLIFKIVLGVTNDIYS